MDLAEVRGKMGIIADDISRKQLEARDLRNMVQGVETSCQNLMQRSGSSAARRRGADASEQSMTERLSQLRWEIRGKQRLIDALILKFADLRAQEDALEQAQSKA